MARTTSTRSKRTKKTEDTPAAEAETVTPTEIEDAVTLDDTPAPAEEGETTPGPAEAQSETDGSDQPDGSAGDDTLTPASPAEEPSPAPVPPSPAPAQRRGPGFVPLLAGGVLAAGIGYGAAYMGVLPVPSTGSDDISALTSAVDAQSQTLANLQSELSTLANAEPPALPEVDLSPVLSEIAALGDRVDGATGSIDDLAGRLTVLEERPVFTGELDQDSAAMAAAVDQLQTQLRDQEGRNEALAEELRSLADEAQAGMTEAQTAIAEAEARAQESVAAATAQAALSRIRIAMAAGDPFADALAELPESIALPEALSAAAETGVPTLADLQSSFPAAARAALPIAIRDSAGDSATDRLGAFLRGQIGGRSLEPREGTDPDAILSRAQAAVTAGDLDTALAEIAALPEVALAEMADWTATAQARNDADAALDGLAAALGGTN